MKNRIAAFAAALTLVSIVGAQEPTAPARDPKPMPPVIVGIKALSFTVGSWTGKGYQMMGDKKMEWAGTLKNVFILQDSHLQISYSIMMDGQKMEGTVVVYPDAATAGTYKGVNFESGGTTHEVMNGKLVEGKLVFAMTHGDTKTEGKMEMSLSGESLKVQMYDKNADGKWVLTNEGIFGKA